jgi:hypothetical protein
MSYDLGWCSIHFSGEKLKATAHVSANELYLITSSFSTSLNRLTLTLSCAMNFMIYPHDTQECKLQMESRE